MQDLTQDQAYQTLLTQISGVYEQGRQKVFQYANHTLVETNWWTGHYIVEFEQQGNAKAKYGKAILENLAKDLSIKYGKGFSRSNLNYMRNLYLFYPICETLSHKLSWSHYCELVKISDVLERSFYEKQCLKESWSVPELKRQKKTVLTK
jgi:predicted nuclease of restriction endonuclease-like (RecB) superfamily